MTCPYQHNVITLVTDVVTVPPLPAATHLTLYCEPAFNPVRFAVSLIVYAAYENGILLRVTRLAPIYIN